MNNFFLYRIVLRCDEVYNRLDGRRDEGSKQ